MASSSTSSNQKINFKYDIFLSFRGKDTRTNFIDHLYHALKQESIETYKDDKNLKRGERISKKLIQAIEDSRFHVIVFSKNYASSSWCLDELVKIMECQKTVSEHSVYPIFYHVKPSEVRKQSGEFGKAFAKHEKNEAAEKWREALVEAASFSGQKLTVVSHEVEFIKMVVNEISLKLPSISVDENLIGMRTRINGVVSSLDAFHDDFCMIGITGMGGSGKTTLARAVFDQICNEFDGSSFVENVRESSNSILLGLKSLQQQVLKDVLNKQDIAIHGVFDGKEMIKNKLQHIKVLVVLDDVDHIDQLKALAGKPNWFKSGSKIIITTRDKQVLLAHRVNVIHDVNLLTDEEAIHLLCICAFGTKSPSPGYEKLSRKVVSYAAGLPLSITILGSSFCDANEHVWIDTLERLKKIPLDETLQKLELSYMGLDTDCKEIFLDIACILKGWKENEAIRALESCGFHAIRGLNILEKKSLITISKDRCLDMHDHLEEMGRYIIRRSNLNEPGRHTRLWIEEEIRDILVNNLGSEATSCIYRVMFKVNGETVMKGLGKMEKLRFLRVDGFAITSDRKLDEHSRYLPNSLQYLKWLHYPFCFLPKTFQASNLVSLEMYDSKILQLWEGRERKVLHKLRFLKFNSSKLKILDLGLTPNLEILDLEFCYDLVELHMHVGCPKLKSLKLNFSKLSTLDLRLVPNIETLDLNVCEDLVELDMPCECPQLRSFNMCSPKLRSLNLGLTPNIKTLNLEYCDGLLQLDMPHECPQLKSLNLSCPNLRSFNLGSTPNIETLKLEECAYLVEFDMSLECRQLESLDLRISKLRTLDLGLTPNLEILKLQGCYNLVELRMHDGCFKLKTLTLGCPQLRTFDLGLTLNLQALTLDGHDELIEFLNLVGCPQLEYLRLTNSKLRTLELNLNLKTLLLEYCGLVELHIPSLGRAPNLENLRLEGCSNLVKFHVPLGGLKKFIHLKAPRFLRFTDFSIVDRSGFLPKLDLYGKLVDICPLHPDNNFPKFLFNCYYKEDLPSSIGNVEKLISVGFSCACTDVHSFFGVICGLQHLTALSLGGSIPEAPKDLHQLQCLEKLSLFSSKIKHIPDSICMLKHLKILIVKDCKLLEKLPEDLGRLECLEKLMLEECIVLRDIPNSVCWMKSLKYFSLRYCQRVEELPVELGRLECLKELDIRGTCINNLPLSILLLKSLRILRSKDETPTTTNTIVCCCTVL